MAKKPTKTKVEVAVKAPSTSSKGYTKTFGSKVKLGDKVNAQSK